MAETGQDILNRIRNEKKTSHQIKQRQGFSAFAANVAKDYADDKGWKNNQDQLIKYLVLNLMETLHDAGMFRNCLNCDHWSTGQEDLTKRETLVPMGCRLARAMPPPKVIVAGCEQHTDIIPF